MMRLTNLAATLGWSLLFLVAIVLLPNGKAHAYLDPGSGSFILQLVIAAIAGSLLTLRVFWGRIKSRITGSEPPPEADGASQAPSDPDSQP